MVGILKSTWLRLPPFCIELEHVPTFFDVLSDKLELNVDIVTGMMVMVIYK